MPDGGSVGDLIAAPDAPQADERAEDVAILAMLAMLASDLLEARALDERARSAEAEAVRCRAIHERRAAAIEARSREYFDAARYAVLAGLSPAQLRVIHARITLAQTGAPVTHHAVARLLGVTPATVSKQWARAQAKMGAVSTSAA